MNSVIRAKHPKSTGLTRVKTPRTAGTRQYSFAVALVVETPRAAGTHRELLTADDLYRELATTQFAAGTETLHS